MGRKTALLASFSVTSNTSGNRFTFSVDGDGKLWVEWYVGYFTMMRSRERYPLLAERVEELLTAINAEELPAYVQDDVELMPSAGCGDFMLSYGYSNLGEPYGRSYGLTLNLTLGEGSPNPGTPRFLYTWQQLQPLLGLQPVLARLRAAQFAAEAGQTPAFGL